MIANKSDKWIPEIFYEEKPDGVTQGLPFVKIPNGRSMPSSIFLCGVEDALDEEVEKDVAVFMYCNMSYLKDRLDEETINKIRTALGLKPLNIAVEEGKKITDKINSNVEKTLE